MHGLTHSACAAPPQKGTEDNTGIPQPFQLPVEGTLETKTKIWGQGGCLCTHLCFFMTRTRCPLEGALLGAAAPGHTWQERATCSPQGGF